MNPPTTTGMALLSSQVIGQLPIDDAWGKMLLQLGIAGLWVYWLTKQLDKQTTRDDKRHTENIAVANDHAHAMERLTLTCYDVLEEIGEAYPNAKHKVREAIRRDARAAIENKVNHEHK